jgi:hypothetical protein
MSRDALAGVYIEMLAEAKNREIIAKHPDILNDWDLTEEEKKVLKEEAAAGPPGPKIESGPVLKYIETKRGPKLSPPIASSLGIAINKALGLPHGSLKGPGFVSNAACCPWGHAVIGEYLEDGQR